MLISQVQGPNYARPPAFRHHGDDMYDQKSGEFKLRAGPLFSNILLADEINRAPPKTQAALLEAEEKQATIEGITHKLPAPFVVLAMQNPIEQEGTYPLPEPKWTVSS